MLATLGATVPVAAAGWSDGTFGDDGRVQIPGDLTQRLVALPDGSSMVSSSVGVLQEGSLRWHGVVERLTPEGELDQSFGDHGVVMQASARQERNEALAALPDGSFVVGGTIGKSVRQHPIVGRYLPDGSPDRRSAMTVSYASP